MWAFHVTASAVIGANRDFIEDDGDASGGAAGGGSASSRHVQP